MVEGFARPVISLPLQFDPEHFRALTRTHPYSERVRWWRAIPDPQYNPISASVSHGRQKWLREEVRNTSDYRAIIVGIGQQQVFTGLGTWQAGDVLILSMPDELPFGVDDWVVPTGLPAETEDPGRVTARLLVHKETLVRGRETEVMGGTVTASGGTAVTGQGTQFTAFLRAGDVISASGVQRRVVSVTSDTACTVDSGVTWQSAAWTRGRERLSRAPAAILESIRDTAREYRVGSDVILSEDGTELEWISGTSPSPGDVVSVVYRHYPVYVVLPERSVARVRVGGVALIQSVYGRLLWAEQVEGVS